MHKARKESWTDNREAKVRSAKKIFHCYLKWLPFGNSSVLLRAIMAGLCTLFRVLVIKMEIHHSWRQEDFLLYAAKSSLVVEREYLGQQPLYSWFVISSVGHVKLLSLVELPSVLFFVSNISITELVLNRDFFLPPPHHYPITRHHDIMMCDFTCYLLVHDYRVLACWWDSTPASPLWTMDISCPPNRKTFLRSPEHWWKSCLH